MPRRPVYAYAQRKESHDRGIDQIAKTQLHDHTSEETGSSSVFGGIRRLLDEQVERSSAPEQQVLRLLAVEREGVRVAEMLAALGPRVSRAAVLEAVEGLCRRS